MLSELFAIKIALPKYAFTFSNILLQYCYGIYAYKKGVAMCSVRCSLLLFQGRISGLWRGPLPVLYVKASLRPLIRHKIAVVGRTYFNRISSFLRMSGDIGPQLKMCLDGGFPASLGGADSMEINTSTRKLWLTIEPSLPPVHNGKADPLRTARR